jgi:glycerol uptake facilitator-like aquaporin
MAFSLHRSAAEFIGTMLLLATVVGSGIMGETLAGGNVAIALLANALATGAMLYVLITALGPVSGAHFNPAVTLVFALKRKIGMAEGAAYVAAQIAGGIAGVVLAHAMFDQPALQLSAHIRTGPGQWLSETVAAAGLVLTILLTMKARAEAAAASVALYIVAAYWFTASTSFANPAVTIARCLTESFAGIRPVDAPMFIVMQIFGALAGLAIAQVLTRDDSTP